MEKILIFAFGMAVMCLLWRIINEMIAINKFISNIFGKTKKRLPNYENTPDLPLRIMQYSESDKSENEKAAEEYLYLCKQARFIKHDINKLKQHIIQYHSVVINGTFILRDFSQPQINEFKENIIKAYENELIKINKKLTELEKQVPFQITKGGDYEID